MTQRIQLIGVALLAFTAGAALLQAEKPNILFILADDVGIEPLGCYGGTSFETPNIDRLAEAGMRFRHCYSMPVCHPTRVCFLTGRYPRHIGNPAWGTFPHELESQTVAQVIRRAGYATAVAGKWQLTLLARDPQHPHRLGFDEYCLFGWHEGARYHDPLIWQNGAQRHDTTGQYGPDLYAEFLIDFMQRNRAQAFFAFYSMALCHDVTDDLDEPVAYAPGKDRYLNYGEMVTSMDQCVGRIVTAVEELGLQRKTLILFSGDNGTARRSIIRAQQTDGEPKKWTYVRDPVFCDINGQRVPGGKGSLTDGGTRVPLLASWPGTIKPGETVDDLVDFSDFLPTFADLCGETIPSGVKLDGISMAARLTGAGPGVRAWAYAESKNRFWVRTQQWKLLNTGEFFDVAADPRESNNLAGVELTGEAKAVKQRLEQALATFVPQRAATERPDD